MKWEYRLFVQSTEVLPAVSRSTPIGELRGDLYERMTELGDEGWELVSAVPIGRDRVLFILKRPKEEG